MSDLKPCPFCGEEEDLHVYEYGKGTDNCDCFVQCQGCSATGRASETDRQGAIDNWNRRTQPEAAPAQDLSAAKKEWRGSLAQVICDVPLPEGSDTYQHGFVTAKKTILEALRKAGFDALSAGDRVDAERYRHLRELMQFSTPPNKPTTMKLRAPIPAPEHNPHRDWVGDQFDASVDRAVDASLRACLTAAEIVDFDTARAALAKKGGT